MQNKKYSDFLYGLFSFVCFAAVVAALILSWQGKIEGLVTGLIFFIVSVIWFVVSIQITKFQHAQTPVLKQYVELYDKIQKKHKSHILYFLLFMSQDGVLKTFKVQREIYIACSKGDKGVLKYMLDESSQLHLSYKFISFEKDLS